MIGMKKAWIAIVAVLLAFVLLRAGCGNQRLVNRLNPVWEVAGHVVSEQGKPISDVDLQVSYIIGYYPVGRFLEQSASVDRETVKPDATGFFSVRKRCDSVIIRVDDPRYEIADSDSVLEWIVFSRSHPRGCKTSDKSLRIILREKPIKTVEPTRTPAGTRGSP
jgi:hypothetical protein